MISILLRLGLGFCGLFLFNKHSAPMGLGCFFVSSNSAVYCRDTILHELITVLTMTIDDFIGKIINLTTSEVPPPT
jgi:hypothetical protein